MSLRRPLLALAILGVVGCATGAARNERAETSSAAIRAAEEVGATHSPEAALHLQLAKEQFERAQKLPSPSDNARADRLLRRAQADAELALAMARSEDDQAEARAALDRMKTLNAPTAQ